MACCTSVAGHMRLAHVGFVLFPRAMVYMDTLHQSIGKNRDYRLPRALDARRSMRRAAGAIVSLQLHKNAERADG